MLHPIKDVDFFTVRLLLSQVLMVLRDQVLESRALYVATLLLQEVMGARCIKVTQDLAVLLVTRSEERLMFRVYGRFLDELGRL